MYKQLDTGTIINDRTLFITIIINASKVEYYRNFKKNWYEVLHGLVVKYNVVVTKMLIVSNKKVKERHAHALTTSLYILIHAHI